MRQFRAQNARIPLYIHGDSASRRTGVAVSTFLDGRSGSAVLPWFDWLRCDLLACWHTSGTGWFHMCRDSVLRILSRVFLSVSNRGRSRRIDGRPILAPHFLGTLVPHFLFLVTGRRDDIWLHRRTFGRKWCEKRGLTPTTHKCTKGRGPLGPRRRRNTAGCRFRFGLNGGPFLVNHVMALHDR